MCFSGKWHKNEHYYYYDLEIMQIVITEFYQRKTNRSTAPWVLTLSTIRTTLTFIQEEGGHFQFIQVAVDCIIASNDRHVVVECHNSYWQSPFVQSIHLSQP
jgi:hypothetical protein